MVWKKTHTAKANVWEVSARFATVDGLWLLRHRVFGFHSPHHCHFASWINRKSPRGVISVKQISELMSISSTTIMAQNLQIFTDHPCMICQEHFDHHVDPRPNLRVGFLQDDNAGFNEGTDHGKRGTKALLVGFLALYGLGPLSNIYFAPWLRNCQASKTAGFDGSSSLMLELGVNACPRLCLEDFESNYTLYSGEIFWLMLKGQQSCFRQITCFLRTEHEYILVVLSVRSHVPRAGCRECQRSRAR